MHQPQYQQYQQYPPPPAPTYCQPPTQQYQQPYPSQQNLQAYYDPSRPNHSTSQSALFCHLPRPFGVHQQYVAPFEETLIVQNPCDLRKEDVTIMNSRREPLFQCSPIHKHGKETMIRSTSGQDLILVRHDPDKKQKTTFALERPDGHVLAWMVGDLGDDVTTADYTVTFINSVNQQNPSEEISIRIEGNFDGDHVDWKFKDTDNRIAALRADFEQVGLSLPDGASGTRVVAGFDLALIAGMQVVMDVHNTEFCEDAVHSEHANKFAGKLARSLGKGVVKGLFAAAGNNN